MPTPGQRVLYTPTVAERPTYGLGPVCAFVTGTPRGDRSELLLYPTGRTSAQRRAAAGEVADKNFDNAGVVGTYRELRPR